MRTVDVLLYEGVDELDFCGPYEILASCRRVVEGRWTEKPAFHVQTVADRRATVQCAHKLCVLPDKSLAEAFEADIIIIPGGPGSRKENLPLHMMEFLKKASDTAEVIASVSTGAYILAKTGLADGHRITTHASHLETLAKSYPAVKVVKGSRVVSSGKAPHVLRRHLGGDGPRPRYHRAVRRQGDRPARRQAPGMGRHLGRGRLPPGRRPRRARRSGRPRRRPPVARSIP